VATFLSQLAAADGRATPPEISKDALDLCISYDWPGNVRHLRSAVEYASVMSAGKTILTEHLPPYLTRKRDPLQD
jgi:DNA-binding NtrC family response regulator